MANIKKILSNPSIIYILGRYGTYAIQFINSLFIAAFLGPYYLGIWGFINLVIGYIVQTNFGISYSVNVLISINNRETDYVKRVVGNGISMIIVLSLSVFLFLVSLKIGMFSIGEKFNFNHFIIPVFIISALTHINALFANVFRVFGKIHAISINQSLYPIIVLFLLPFFRGEDLLWAMLYANAAAFIISFVLFLIQSPIKLLPLIDWKIIKMIQVKGWHLFIYGSAYYVIILSTNTIISSNYSVQEFGFYTFSFTLANVVLLLLNSLSFLIFPKLLNRFATLKNFQIGEILASVRRVYISFSHFLIHLVIMVFPLFLAFFPSYNDSYNVFKFIALTIVLNSNSFGYQGLLLARGKEKLIGRIAILALLINLSLCFILVYILNVGFEHVILATLFTYLIYVFISAMYGRKEINLKSDFLATIKDVYPLNMMLPYVLSLIFALFSVQAYFFVVPFLLYVVLNFKDLLQIKETAKRIVNNKNFINI